MVFLSLELTAELATPRAGGWKRGPALQHQPSLLAPLAGPAPGLADRKPTLLLGPKVFSVLVQQSLGPVSAVTGQKW